MKYEITYLVVTTRMRRRTPGATEGERRVARWLDAGTTARHLALPEGFFDSLPTALHDREQELPHRGQQVAGSRQIAGHLWDRALENAIGGTVEDGAGD